MVGGKSDANKSNTRKTREFWGKSWMEKPVEVPEHIGEREKERTVKEFALFVEKGIDEGLYRQNTSTSEPDCYYHNNTPGTSNAALAEKAAVNY